MWLCDPLACSPLGCPWNYLGKNTAVGSYSILSPGVFPDPGIEPRSPELQADSLPSEQPGKPQLWLANTTEELKEAVERINHKQGIFFFFPQSLLDSLNLTTTGSNLNLSSFDVKTFSFQLSKMKMDLHFKGNIPSTSKGSYGMY